MKPVIILFGLLILIPGLFFFACCDTTPEEIILELDRAPVIEPDYADVTIDPYLCYRLLYPGYKSWSQIDIIQRDIENFHESSLAGTYIVEGEEITRYRHMWWISGTGL